LFHNGKLSVQDQWVDYYSNDMTDEHFKHSLMNDQNFNRITYTLFEKKMSSGLVKRDLAVMLALKHKGKNYDIDEI
jgi:hypothetical protein